MSTYILFGYQFSDFTVQSKDLLDDNGIDYEFRVVTEIVHPDGSHPLGITRVPALRLSDNPSKRLADGIDEIEQWLKNR